MHTASQPFQVVGGPGWLTSERYQIDAKADATASRDRMFLMLQSLLEDRFQLKTHRDTKELPVFALVADKGGAKLPSTEGRRVRGLRCGRGYGMGRWWKNGSSRGGSTQPRVDAAPPSLVWAPGGAQMHGGKIAMPELVRTLSHAARPKRDRQDWIYGTFRPATGFRAGRYHTGNAASAAWFHIRGHPSRRRSSSNLGCASNPLKVQSK